LRSWTPQFDAYDAHDDDTELHFEVDLAAEAHLPVSTHPVRLEVKARVDDRLSNLARALVPALEACEAIYVGLWRQDDNVTFVFYEPQDCGSDEALAAVDANDLLHHRSLDPHWQFYRDFLLPDPLSRALMRDREQLQWHADHGDRTSTPRIVEHRALFTTRPLADSAKLDLEASGFLVEEPASEIEDLWSLTFTRVDEVTAERIEDITFEILEALRIHDGEYEGWTAPIVDHDA
jgi:hypothetical protein